MVGFSVDYDDRSTAYMSTLTHSWLLFFEHVLLQGEDKS